jgi:hypothetical protein
MDFLHVKMILKLSMGLNLHATLLTVSVILCSATWSALERKSYNFCLSESINLTQWGLSNFTSLLSDILSTLFPIKEWWFNISELLKIAFQTFRHAFSHFISLNFVRRCYILNYLSLICSFATNFKDKVIILGSQCII